MICDRPRLTEQKPKTIMQQDIPDKTLDTRLTRITFSSVYECNTDLTRHVSRLDNSNLQGKSKKGSSYREFELAGVRRK